MSARFRTLALVLATWVSATGGTLGCKKLFKRAAGDGGVTTTIDAGSTNTPQDDADEQMQEKVDAYILCLNNLSSPVHATRARYFSWVNPKTGPTGKETNVYGLFDLPNDVAKKCTDGIAKSKIMPPRDANLEKTGDDFAKAVTDLDALIDEAFPYYENKNYKDDKFAKGKALHPKLMAAFQTFSTADNNMHNTLDGITKPLAQRALARIEREEGRKFRYHRKHVLVTARDLIDAGAPVGENDFVDFPKFNTAFTAFDQALSDLQTYAGVHRNELDAQTNPAWPLAKSNLDQFVRASDDYRKKAREYMRCLRDAPAKAKLPDNRVDPDKMGPCPDGRPKDVVNKYNDFINTSNDRSFP